MTIWRKSSHSGTQGGTECVEVANLSGHTIAVRDSKNPNGPRLHLTPTQWSALLTTIKSAPPSVR